MRERMTLLKGAEPNSYVRNANWPAFSANRCATHRRSATEPFARKLCFLFRAYRRIQIHATTTMDRRFVQVMRSQ